MYQIEAMTPAGKQTSEPAEDLKKARALAQKLSATLFEAEKPKVAREVRLFEDGVLIEVYRAGARS